MGESEKSCHFVRFPHYWGLGSLFLFLLLLALPAHARPQVLVIFADHLTLADVMRSDLPNFAKLRQQSEMALMSPGLAQKPDSVANVYATLGAGDSVRVGDVSQGRMAAALHRAGVRTALIGDADGDDTGPYRPALFFLSTPDFVSDGAIADPIAPGGKREDAVRLWAATQAAYGTCDLVVVHFGDFARAERENQRGFLLPSAYQAHCRRALLALDAYLDRVINGFRGSVLLVVPTPSLLRDGSWNQLTPFFSFNAGSQGSLTSDTTQTPGLIAARDVAPTVLAALQVPAPLQMTGALVHRVIGANLVRLDRLTRLNQEAQNPVFWTVGLGASLIVFSGLGLYLTKRMAGRTGLVCRYGLRIVSAWPLALLLASLANPQAVGGYLGVIAGLTGLIALLPSPAAIFMLTAVILVGDGLTGTTLVSNSALSEYALSGIRFYGIGNEYMGVLIGGALLACIRPREDPIPAGKPATPPSEGRDSHSYGRVRSLAPLSRLRGWGLLPFWFALVTFVLSFPSFGAKAGGAVTATATFAVAWRLMRGKSVTWKHLLGSIAAGFALVFLWALLSHILHLRRTHLETAVGALGQGRFGYIVGVSLRKIGLAARVLLHPGTLLGLLAFALMAITIRRLLWQQVTVYLAVRPREIAVWQAGLWGCLVALIFNDSGIVAAILILQCLALTLLHGLFGETHAPSGA